MNNAIIITGCAGLIGCHLSRYLLDRDYTIIGIDDLSGGYEEYLPIHKNFIFYKLNLSNKDSQTIIYNIFDKYKPICCYHLAAYAAEGLSPFIRHYNYTNNILSSANIINGCIKYNCKLIFTSSMAVYGDSEPPFSENMNPKPVDPYGIAKYAVEMDIKQASDQFNLNYTIIRPHNVIGIYQNIWDRYRNVIGIFINRIINNLPILIYGDGEQTRAFSDIQYYCDPFTKTINDHNKEIFNIGADKYFTINQIADTLSNVCKKHGYSVIKKHTEPRHEVKYAYCNHDKAKKLLSFEDKTDIESLIESMFIWAKKQTKKDIKNMSYEIDKNIYSFWK